VLLAHLLRFECAWQLRKPLTWIALLVFLAATSAYIYHQTSGDFGSLPEQEQYDWKQQYEQKYRAYESMALPTVASVQTQINLYPNGYRSAVKGRYKLVNPGPQPIDSLLLNWEPDVRLEGVRLVQGRVM
jgi:ABC-2 type transport system permease protein